MNIDGQIKKLNMMPVSKERSMQFRALREYLHFLHRVENISKEEFADIMNGVNESNYYIEHFATDEYPRVQEMLNIENKLNGLYKGVLNYAKHYSLFTEEIPLVNLNKMRKAVTEFLKFIDNDAYRIYNDLINDKLIYEALLKDAGGVCYNISGDKTAIVLKYDTAFFYKALSLVHEIGHSYYFYLARTNPHLAVTGIAIESMSRTFEQLFLLYLKENHIIDSNVLAIYERFFLMQQLDIINGCYIVNRLLSNNQIKPSFYLSEIKPDLSYEDYCKSCIIKPVNEEEFKDYLSYNRNYYAYGHLLSMVIRERFSKDEQETRKLIKDIPYLAKVYTASEFIDLFSKNEYMNANNKNTARVLKKTHYKKQKI